ncbi:MAG: hypothetical protein K5860_03205 [Bacteroidales bacterium]|nr:hypothetical protein [Bacteroidales bacterium]
MNIIYTILILYGIVCLTILIIAIAKEWDTSSFFDFFKTDLDLFETRNIFTKSVEYLIFIVVVCVAFVFIFALIPFIYFSGKKRDKKDDKSAQKETQNEEEKKEEDCPHYQFRMRHNDMIRPDVNQIYYIETSYNQEINNFFERNLDRVKELFQTDYNKSWCTGPLDFIYLPRAIQDLNINDFLFYNRPDISNETVISKEELLKYIQNEYINGLYGNLWGTLYPILQQPVEHSAEGVTIKQGFIHYKRTEFNKFTNITEDQYTYVPLEYENDEQFFDVIKKYLAKTGTVESAYSNRKTYDDIPPEYDEEVQQITKEIQERVKRLQCIGLNNMIINKLVLPEITLSKLRITKDYKIFLTDYNNTEIVMPTLSKTLYFFYLRHPEGVPFKLLENHKEELFQIYKRITNRDDIDALRKSIDYLVDPQYNSINEKASRIKTAFVNAFDDNIAQNYYISLHDTAVALNRRITLDRNLVIDEAGIVKF